MARRITTSHSDENPELTPNNPEGQPLAAHSTEGSPIDDLYKREKERKKLLGVRPEEMDHIVSYEDNEGNYWEKQ